MPATTWLRAPRESATMVRRMARAMLGPRIVVPFGGSNGVPHEGLRALTAHPDET